MQPLLRRLAYGLLASLFFMVLSRLLTRPLTSSTSNLFSRSVPGQSNTLRAMHIQSIPMCTCILVSWRITANTSTGVGSSNNYAYLVSDDASKEAVIIDPANPPEYLPPPSFKSHTYRLNQSPSRPRKSSLLPQTHQTNQHPPPLGPRRRQRKDPRPIPSPRHRRQRLCQSHRDPRPQQHI